MLNWKEVSLLAPDRQRGAVHVAAKNHLDHAAGVYSTGALATDLLALEDLRAVAAVSRILVRLASKGYFAKYATHDGETYLRFGRDNKRWRWHGQAKEAKKEPWE